MPNTVHPPEARAGPEVFARCREAISAQAAAEYYGVQVRRGWARCPLHGEKTPSLKFYPDGHFYCFGCHAGGSAVDFTARLLGLSPQEAALRLCQDFGLSLPAEAPPSRRQSVRRAAIRSTRQDYDAWREEMLRILCRVCLAAHEAMLAMESGGPDTLSPGQAMALRWREAAEDWSEALLSDSMEEQMKIFRMRHEVKELCTKILNSISKKFGAA